MSQTQPAIKAALKHMAQQDKMIQIIIIIIIIMMTIMTIIVINTWQTRPKPWSCACSLREKLAPKPLDYNGT